MQLLRAKHGWANVRYTNQIYDYLEILEDLDQAYIIVKAEAFSADQSQPKFGLGLYHKYSTYFGTFKIDRFFPTTQAQAYASLSYEQLFTVKKQKNRLYANIPKQA